jgi:hypothetical protein
VIHTLSSFFLQNPKYLANTPNNFAQEARQRLQFQPCSVLTEAHELLRGMAGTIAGCNATDETTTIVKKWVGMHVRRFPDRHISEPLPSVPAMVAQINRVLQRCHQDHAAETQHVSTPCATTGDENGDSQTNVTLASCCALIFSNDPDWAKMKIRATCTRCVQFVDNELLEDPALKGLAGRQNGWATNYGRDSAALSLCDCLVITVGSFGYFAGILHGGHGGKHDHIIYQQVPILVMLQPREHDKRMFTMNPT